MVKFNVGDKVVVLGGDFKGKKGKIIKIGFFSDISEKNFDYAVKLSGKNQRFAKGRLGFNEYELMRI